MDTIIILLLVSVLLAVLLAVVNAILFFKLKKTHKKIDELLDQGKIKSLKDVLLKQKERHEELEEQIKKAFLQIRGLQNTAEKTIQKTGVVRFNPFNEMGGNQSFTIALLDEKDNGFVISSLFVKEGNRVYAKSVKGGKSDHLLSNEEQEAINKAIGSK
jgi:Na+-translocating ferredoxin:NAD+ oxidoreductase RnfG subunit